MCQSEEKLAPIKYETPLGRPGFNVFCMFSLPFPDDRKERIFHKSLLEQKALGTKR